MIAVIGLLWILAIGVLVGAVAIAVVSIREGEGWEVFAGLLLAVGLALCACCFGIIANDVWSHRDDTCLSSHNQLVIIKGVPYSTEVCDQWGREVR